ncbi:MAG: hypothetical protein JSV63_03010 [Candidatus Aenigmatarchaeota archaeon]|nr:MAG: hypothetical protein JSV63_03010 [Candidatus Aenigmarchaeota archaeon]
MRYIIVKVKNMGFEMTPENAATEIKKFLDGLGEDGRGFLRDYLMSRLYRDHLQFLVDYGCMPRATRNKIRPIQTEDSSLSSPFKYNTPEMSQRMSEMEEDISSLADSIGWGYTPLVEELERRIRT